jgi:uncharacterized protein involved in exopolysaccharide biosynthesis/Mrp family chromosome partitioning ATPase
MNTSITPAPKWQQVPVRPTPAPPPPRLNRNDFLFALFRHKKMIIILTLIGLVAAAVIFFLYPPRYQSQAKLLVRYVVDRSAVDSLDAKTEATSSSRSLDAIIGAEVEILTSWDVAMQVADGVGPKRILEHSSFPVSKEAAALVVARGLTVTAQRGSNIIYVAFQDSDPQLAPLVLNEVLSRYFIKHLEVHRSAGAFDFVSQQTDQVRARLDQTEDALKKMKAKLGIVSLADGMATLSAELAKTDDQLHSAEADLAEQRARVVEMHLPLPGTDSAATKVQSAASPAASPAAAPKATAAGEPSDRVVEDYQDMVTRLAKLQQTKGDLLTKYKPGSVMVQVTETQINDLMQQRSALEKKYPDLPARARASGSSLSRDAETVSEPARLAGLEARTKELRTRLEDVKARMKQLTELAPDLGDLERKKDLEETNYKYFAGSLEKARIDEALDPSKIPNISAVQRPTPPLPLTSSRNKLAGGVAVSGLIIGIALALIRELLLSQTVKRPSQLEAQLHVPLLLSIPQVGSNGHKPLPEPDKKNGASLVVSPRPGLAPWDSGHFIRKYCEAIRDRIGLYFELHSLTHKPKLVGVTGFSSGAGTSTLAAGLAAALSETDDGKVLLVDANLGPGDVHPFFQGKPAYSLHTALQPPDPIDPAAKNLYLASVGNSQAGPAQLGLKRFFDLMPNLRASDFDYIIFDLPPLTSISQTWGMAAFMDKLLLVVEAEKSNRDLVKRGYAKLMAERDNVSVVLNKARSYIPKSLDDEV